MRFHSAHVRHLCRPSDGLVLVSPPPLCHRVDPVKRVHPPGTPQPLPPLLQPCALVAGRLVSGPGLPAGRGVCPRRPPRVGCGQYALPQARFDHLRHRHAPRSAHLQPGQAAVSWGKTTWVVLCLIVRCPWWSPTKVWCLPVLFRLYHNRQGLTKGRKGQKPKADPQHRTRPQLAVEMIGLFAAWFPGWQMLLSGDGAYGGQSVLRELPANVDLISHANPKGLCTHPPLHHSRVKPALRKKGRGCPAWLPGQLILTRFGRCCPSISSGCTPPCGSRRSRPCTTRRARTAC